MAKLDPEAIRGAIVENLDGTVEGIRQLNVGEASGDIHSGASDEMKAQRAVVRPHFAVTITEINPNKNAPMGHTSLTLWDITVVLKCVYNLQGPGVDHVDYDDRKAVAETQAVQFAHRMMLPGVVTDCISLGRPTGIVSGKLTPNENFYRVTRDDPEKSLFEVEQTYTAVVRVNAAIS